VAVLLWEPDGSVGASGLGLGVVSASVMPSARSIAIGGFARKCKETSTGQQSKDGAHGYERKRLRTYARRSMMGAQFLLAMRARRSRRALSISAMYSASTTGATSDIAAELEAEKLKKKLLSRKQGSSALVWTFGAGDREAGELWFCREGREGEKGGKRGIEWSGGVEKARDVSRGQQGVLLISISFF